MKRINLEEEIVWYYLLLTYVWYFLGAQYILAPLLGWFLVGRLLYKLWKQTDATPVKQRVSIPLGVWIWVIGVCIVGIAQAIGLITSGYTIFKVVSTLIFQWSRGYALFGIFPLIGCLNIRPKLWYRIACILCIQSLIFIPVFIAGYLLHIPGYISPLHYIGRQGEIAYGVSFYRASAEEGGMRLSLFAPWAPGLGFVATCLFFLVREESNKVLKYLSMLSAVLMIAVSVSRLGVVTLPITICLIYFVTRIKYPTAQFLLSLELLLAGIFAPKIYEELNKAKEAFTAQRADSSKVRDTLTRIGLHRWWNESPIWGHGLQESGPKMTAFMPIGTHHTWVAILFTSGIVGIVGILIPYFISLLYFIVNSQKSTVGRICLSTLIVMGLYSFGETWDSLVYLLMPSIALFGKGFQSEERQVC